MDAATPQAGHDTAVWSGFDIRPRLPADPRGECQIQNSTSNLYLLVVPLILTFAR